MSDRNLVLPSRALAQRYNDTVQRARRVSVRSTWTAAVLSNFRSTPASNFPGPATNAELPGWPTSSFNPALPAAERLLPKGRWVVTIEVTQDVIGGSDVFSTFMTMAISVDNVIQGLVLVQESRAPGRFLRTMRKSLSVMSDGSTVVKALSGYGYIPDPGSTVTQVLESASIIAYPG